MRVASKRDAAQRWTREGYELSTDSDWWQLSRDITIGLAWTRTRLSTDLERSFRAVMAHYAEKYAPGTLRNAATRFRQFVLSVTNDEDRLTSITDVHVINYRAHLGSEGEALLAPLSRLLDIWAQLHMAGLHDGVTRLLDSWRLKGSEKGAAVRTMCPQGGPLTELEHEALCRALDEAFSTGEIALSDYVLVDLLIATGRRPVQIGDLKLRDLVVSSDENGDVILRVPRRKQEAKWRSEFKVAYLTQERGLSLIELAKANSEHIRSRVPEIPTEVVRDLPLFPNWQRILDVVGSSHETLASLMSTEAFHLPTAALSNRVRETVDALNVISERTGKPLRVFPLRLRRNIATRAARQGFGTLVIAELLDHSDDQNAHIYTANVPEHVDAINAAVAAQLAPVAQAFAGTLVNGEAEAVRGDDPSSRVRCDTGAPVGTCGSYSFCHACAPIACYTCKSFQPWLDAPHQGLLDALTYERQRVLEVTRDESIARINDRTILAVAEVIRRCAERRESVHSSDARG